MNVRHRVWLFQLGLCTLIALGACRESARPDGDRLCIRVIDGDTIMLDGRERVRLIGVDTPESVDPRREVEFFGKEASAFTKSLVLNKRVRLDYEPVKHDRHGRTLAYVYLDDGTLINLEIVRSGYGHAYTRYPFRLMAEFRDAEREARRAQRGMWAQD